MTTELGTLAELQLRDDELNLIVIGSGYGEAILVDLPGRGWLVLDGAGRASEAPVVELLAKHLGEQRIEALILTHPHRDHLHGMLDLLDHPVLGAQIDKIGCVGAFIDSGEAEHHSFALETASWSKTARSPQKRASGSATKALLRRIREIWTEEPARRLELSRGALELSDARIQARVLAPGGGSIRDFFRPEGLSRRIDGQANLLSTVIELRFGGGRYLLTGDLSDPSWAPLAELEPDLDQHTATKLPHHGSEHAQPLSLLRSTATPRTWVLTPFNRGQPARKLPTIGSLTTLFEHEAAVHVTAFPVAWKEILPAPERVSLDQLSINPVRLREELGQVESATRRELSADDCFWMFSFDELGTLTRSVRGRAATRIEK